MPGTSKSPHVLNAASNLMGICFIVLTSLKVLKLSDSTFLDEMTMAPTVMFMTSCLCSYLSIRTEKAAPERAFERVADVTFIIGLSLLFVVMLLLAFNFMK